MFKSTAFIGLKTHLSVESSCFFGPGFEANFAASPERMSGDASFSSCTLTQNDFSDNLFGKI